MPKGAKRLKTSATLSRVGIWATVWWGISCFYLLLLVWAAKDGYAARSAQKTPGGALSDWQSAISSAYHDSTFLPLLLAAIIAVWIVGGIIWLRALKRAKVSYKAAFKDLFLTIR